MKTTRNSFILMLLVALLASTSTQAQILKRWSPQAKGTAIGVGTGAAAGAIIHKRNRVVGGIVGGVVGGAVGYGIGKHIDNKRKKSAREMAQQQDGYPVLAASNDPAPSITKRSTPVEHRSLLATKPASTPASQSNPALYILNGGYLANPYLGDPTMPYNTTEFRQKSW